MEHQSTLVLHKELGYRIIRVSTPADFIDAISPIGGFLPPLHEIQGRFLFRGDGNSEYQIIPKTWRDENAKQPMLFGRAFRMGCLSSVQPQIIAEAETLLTFIEACNLNGLYVPEYVPIRGQLIRWIKGDPPHQTWPHPLLYQVMSLAEHVGIPTRLVNWSTNPYVAAYFAATSALSREQPTEALALWMYSIADLPWPDDTEIYVLTMPSFGNVNLRAQQGRFTLIHTAWGEADRDFTPTPHDKYLVNLPDGKERLFKIVMKTEHAPELLRILGTLGFDASTLFPGYEGVSRHFHELAKWPSEANWYRSTYHNDLIERAKEIRSRVIR